MTNSNEPMRNINPYFLLEVSQNATDEEIQASFHAKMKSSKDREQLVNAYSKIRNQSARNQFKWMAINSFMADPKQGGEGSSSIALDELIQELAFLSDWETGDLQNV
ncbi:MAG: hypothetical protein H0W50_04245 [Parachlamydiaceae bacterium]|nr:hypothetical protein [Parachlamydiaceae bacterium]